MGMTTLAAGKCFWRRNDCHYSEIVIMFVQEEGKEEEMVCCAFLCLLHKFSIKKNDTSLLTKGSHEKVCTEQNSRTNVIIITKCIHTFSNYIHSSMSFFITISVCVSLFFSLPFTCIALNDCLNATLICGCQISTILYQVKLHS